MNIRINGCGFTGAGRPVLRISFILLKLRIDS